MRKGYDAAKQTDYLSAIRHFEEARKIAPHDSDIYYNLGLAEAQIPGRDLRSIVWFGAYLSADPGSLLAPAVKKQIKILGKKDLVRFLTIVEEAAAQNPDANERNMFLVEAADLWARAGYYSEAFKAAGRIQAADQIALAQRNIADAQAGAGDIDEPRYVAALPTENPRKMFDDLYATGKKMIEAYKAVDGMLKEMEKSRVNPPGESK